MLAEAALIAGLGVLVADRPSLRFQVRAALRALVGAGEVDHRVEADPLAVAVVVGERVLAGGFALQLEVGVVGVG